MARQPSRVGCSTSRSRTATGISSRGWSQACAKRTIVWASTSPPWPDAIGSPANAGDPVDLPLCAEPYRIVMIKIGSIVINSKDFDRTVAFWQEALHYVPRGPAEREFTILKDPARIGPNLSVQETDELKFGKNRMHLDLYATDQKAEVERLLKLGATIHQAAREGEDFVIMADPEGKLFCVVQLAHPSSSDKSGL